MSHLWVVFCVFVATLSSFAEAQVDTPSVALNIPGLLVMQWAPSSDASSTCETTLEWQRSGSGTINSVNKPSRTNRWNTGGTARAPEKWNDDDYHKFSDSGLQLPVYNSGQKITATAAGTTVRASALTAGSYRFRIMHTAGACSPSTLNVQGGWTDYIRYKSKNEPSHIGNDVRVTARTASEHGDMTGTETSIVPRGNWVAIHFDTVSGNKFPNNVFIERCLRKNSQDVFVGSCSQATSNGASFFGKEMSLRRGETDAWFWFKVNLGNAINSTFNLRFRSKSHHKYWGWHDSSMCNNSRTGVKELCKRLQFTVVQADSDMSPPDTDTTEVQEEQQDSVQQSDLVADIQARIDKTVEDSDTLSGHIWRRALAAVQGEDPPAGLGVLTRIEAEQIAHGHQNNGNDELADLWQRISEQIVPQTEEEDSDENSSIENEDQQDTQPTDEEPNDPQVVNDDGGLTDPNPVNTGSEGSNSQNDGVNTDEREYDFDVHAARVMLFPTEYSRTEQTGLLRLTNRSDVVNNLTIKVFGEQGRSFPGIELNLDGRQAKTIRTSNLEAYGIENVWSDLRFEISGTDSFAALGYLLSDSGRFTPSHTISQQSQIYDFDVVDEIVDEDALTPELTTPEPYRIYTFNAADDIDNVSSLRLINLGQYFEEITITATDDSGSRPEETYEVMIAPKSSHDITASDIEAEIGTGFGRWRLGIEASEAVLAQNWLTNAQGELSNLSVQPISAIEVDETAQKYTVPLFPSTDSSLEHYGVLRLINRSDSESVNITVTAVDDGLTVTEGELTIALNGNEAVELTTDDLELGNSDKGLVGSLGQGQGDWRLTVIADQEGVDALAYVASMDGFLTPIHSSVVPVVSMDEETEEVTSIHYEIPYFLPAISETPGSLRLVNPTETDTTITIKGVDDLGVVRSEEGITYSVAAESTRVLLVEEMERGSKDFVGSIGNGWGAWILTLESDVPILVQNMVGRTVNLSVQPVVDYLPEVLEVSE